MSEAPSDPFVSGLRKSAFLDALTAHVHGLAAFSARLPIPTALVVLAALPLLLLLIDHTWLFPRPDTVDPWMYVGFFLRPKFMLNIFPVYHATRLPIILPGAVYFHLFRPIWQSYCSTHLFYASTFSLYFGLRSLVGVRASLLAAVIAGTNAMFLSAMGQTHADAFGVTYALITAALVVRATTGRGWRAPLFLAGCAYALFLFSNIAYLPMSILFPWLVATLPRDRENKRLTVGFASVLAGFLALTGLLCFANFKLCGRFMFFIPWLNAMVQPFVRVCPHSPWTGSNTPPGWSSLPHARRYCSGVVD